MKFPKFISSSDRALLAQVRTLERLQASTGTYLHYEGMLAQQYRQIVTPSSVVIDIGAHLGDHTREFLRLTAPDGMVIAFEPLPDLAKKLSMELATSRRCKVYQIALSNCRRRSSFVHAKGTPGESGLLARAFNAPALAAPEEITVEVDLLDNYVAELPRLDYVKLDIEGGELDCLEGGRQAISRFRPVISVEFWYACYEVYGKSRADLFRFADRHDYVLCDLFGNQFRSERTWLNAADRAYWDYFLVPAENRRVLALLQG